MNALFPDDLLAVAWRSLLVLLMAMGTVSVHGQDSANDYTPLGIVVEQFVLEGQETRLDQKAVDERLKAYTGRAITIEEIEKAADIVQAMLLESGHDYYLVSIPTQNLGAQGGVRIRFDISRYEWGSIRFNESKYHDEKQIEAAIRHVRPENTRALHRIRALANDNPSKRYSSIRLSESSEPGRIDAVVDGEYGDPRIVSLGLNNTGTPATGKTRAQFAYVDANALRRDHVLVATYSTSPEHPSDVRQYGLFYSVPRYDTGDKFSGYFVYSDVDQGTVADTVQVRGAGRFYGMRYTHLFDTEQRFEDRWRSVGGKPFRSQEGITGDAPVIAEYSHRLHVGIDRREFRNDVRFGGTPLGVDVSSTPFVLEYVGVLARGKTTWNLSGGFNRNLSLGPDDDPETYDRTRAGADVHWVKFEAAVAANFSELLGRRTRLHTQVSAQVAGEPLIPGEQFGLGGVGSVRGFREREVLGDDGYLWRTELYYVPPQAAPGAGSIAWPYPLVFFDTGYVQRHNVLLGQRDDDRISGAGAGLVWEARFSRSRALQASLYAARVLRGTDAGTHEGTTRVHFDLSYRF